MASANTPDNITLSNNHKNPLISQVDLNNQIYDIHDDNAVHTLSDLANLGMDTTGIFVFKGTVAKVQDLPTTGNKVGYVYHVTANHSEYIWAKVDNGTTEGWEEFGEHFVVNHTHNIPELSGTAAAQIWSGSGSINNATAAAQTWTQSSTGNSVTIVGENQESSVSGSGSVTIPTVTPTATYTKISTGTDTFVKSYPGATSKLATTSITGVSGSTTASKATAGTPVSVATTDTAKTVATKATSATTVGNADVGAETAVVTAISEGEQASWSASVANGVLSFSFTPNTLQEPTTGKITPAKASTTQIYGCGDNVSITPAKGNGTITPYTFNNVTVPQAAASATTVATGSLDKNGGGSTVMTGLGTPVATTALTSASLAEGTNQDGFYTGDKVTVGSENKDVNITGTAAAQVWDQKSGSITVKGTNKASTVTGNVTVTGTNQASTVTIGANYTTGAPNQQ